MEYFGKINHSAVKRTVLLNLALFLATTLIIAALITMQIFRFGITLYSILSLAVIATGALAWVREGVILLLSLSSGYIFVSDQRSVWYLSRFGRKFKDVRDVFSYKINDENFIVKISMQNGEVKEITTKYLAKDQINFLYKTL